jgi:membrane-associated phospholipid phosphatase
MNLLTIFSLLIICIALSVIELNLNEDLEESSSKVILYIQDSSSPAALYLFSVIESITSICFLVVSGVIYLAYNRDEGFLCVMSAYMGAGVSGILKTLFTHPRPLWKYSYIYGITCPKDWGSPSGHSMAVGTPLLVMLWLSQRYKNKYSAVIILMLFITGIDRLYVGAHFYFQIILGYAFAALIACIICYGYERNKFKTQSIKFVIFSHIFFGFLIFLSWLGHEYKVPMWEKFWTENFEEKCNGKISPENAMNKNMVEGFLGFTMAGLVFGRFLTGNTRSGNKYKVISFIIFWATVHYSIVMDKTIKSSHLTLGIGRYCTGVFMGYGLPLLLKVIQG